jgi:tRNA pseudouridine55 synthase
VQGILLVDKPAGWTSFDVVNYVRKIVAMAEGKKPRNTKVGHTGTLDPFATGLLVLLIGKEYTRKAGELSKADKTYEVTMHLGQVSTTGDPEGEITDVNGPLPSREDVVKTLQKFTSIIEQTPPAYSAIKVNGQRAYKLARAGKEVIIEPRKVTVHELELVSYSYPEAQLKASVSSGTYIRTLVEDIARALGTKAYTTALRRTQVGSFKLEEAIGVEGITSEALEESLKA